MISIEIALNDLIFWGLGAFLIITSIKLVKAYLSPFYFSFSEVITGFSHDLTWLALLIRMSTPLIVIFVLTFLNPSVSRFYFMPGLISSFLLVWPNILESKLIPENLQNKKKELYLIYLFFVLSFAFLSQLGGNLAITLKTSGFRIDLLPSWVGLRDGVWATIFVGLYLFVLKRLRR